MNTGKYLTKSGKRLDSWMTIQRKRYKDGVLLPERVNKLNELEGWEWMEKG